MKRLFVMLMLCLLLPACAAAFDLSPYALEPLGEYDFTHSVLPISRSEYLRVHSHSIPGDTLVWTLDQWKDGKQHLELKLPKEKYASYTPIFLQGGAIGILKHSDRIEGNLIWKQDYTLYDLVGGELTNPRMFDGRPYILDRFDGGFAGVCGETGQPSELLIYDDALNLRLRHTLPLSEARLQDVFSHNGDVYVLILHQGMEPDVLVLRIRKNNTVAWTYAYNEIAYYYNNLITDGQGGALLTGALESDYKQYRVMHLNADGACDWAKTLSAKKAIVHPTKTIVKGDGTVTLYGYVVAKSRGLFNVYALNIDAQGNVLSVDMRDYSARADTAPKLLFSHDGTPFVYSRGGLYSGGKGFLVPFNDLPTISPPAFTFQ